MNLIAMKTNALKHEIIQPIIAPEVHAHIMFLFNFEYIHDG